MTAAGLPKNKLKLNPNNPRRTKASLDADAQLTANIQAIGIIQPPLVKQKGSVMPRASKRDLAGEGPVS